MKALRFASTALIAALALGATAMPALASTPMTTVNRVQARQLLDQTTAAYDQAYFGFINHPRPEIQNSYDYEYTQGVDAFNRGDYVQAVNHLNQAKQILLNTQEWAERQ
jgi:hypothetical protein